MDNKFDKDQEIKIVCRRCKHVTNHSVLHSLKIMETQEELEVWQETEYLTAQCKGCEIVCLFVRSLYSEDIDPETGNPEYQIQVYPDPIQNRKEVEKSHYLPSVVSQIYRECIKAMNNNSPILTGIGLRSIVEAICRNQNILTGDLKEKIDTLSKKGFITKQEAELLHMNRFMGNAAAHELQEPEKEELSVGMDIVEAALRNAYILPKQAEFLKKMKEFKKGT